MALISPWLHGLIDYSSAMKMALLPRVFGWRPELTRAMDAAAAGSALYSVATDYELGAVPALTMRQHLAIDTALGIGFIAAAALLRNEPASVRLPLLGFGVVALTAASLTDAGPESDDDVVPDPGVP